MSWVTSISVETRLRVGWPELDSRQEERKDSFSSPPHPVRF